MNNQILRFALCALALSVAGTAFASDSDTLFPPDQLTLQVYGEIGTGDIDFTGGKTKVSGETTTTTIVAAPTTPTPPPPPPPNGVITVATRPSFRSAAVIRPFSTTTTTTTTVVGGQEIETTKTRFTKEVSTVHTDHTAGGGGVQLAYYFNRYFGLAAEGDFLGGDPFISWASGQVILRYPFDMGRKPTTGGFAQDAKDVRGPKDYKDYKGSEMSPPTWGIAPYFICGGGAQWDGEGLGVADVGGGVEVRCAAGWNVFMDGRWVVHDSRQNYADVRLGLGYSFY